MRGTLRILLKDLYLNLGFRSAVLALGLPVLLVLLVGQLQVRDAPVRVLIAGQPEADSDRTFQALRDVLGQAGMLKVTEQEAPAPDPLAALRTGGFDLLLNVEGNTSDQWLVYTAVLEKNRLALVQQVAAGLERFLLVVEAEAEAEAEPKKPSDPSEQRLTELSALGVLSLRRAFNYFPQATDGSSDLLSHTLALIVCFVPFMLTAPGLVRERADRTLETLLAAPQVTGDSLVAGSCAAAVILTLFEFVLSIVLVQSIYGIHVKEGFLRITLLLLPALAASALLGLAVSATVRSQIQSALFSAVYFIALALFTGLFFPLDEASTVIRALSYFLPVTFVHPLLQSWMAGAPPESPLIDMLAFLAGQCVLFGLFATLAVRRAIRAI